VPQLRPPPQVLDIARRLESKGFEAWCVGGAIRDALLGHPHLDWDFATSARPEQVREVFGFRRTVPVGVEFGTVGVLDSDGVMHEVTTFRRDVKTDGRHAEVEFGVSLDDDLARRDFTINAIAYSPSRDELRDPFEGRGDLQRRVVRAVGDANARMREDRLRALRALRFAARFEFRIDPKTLDAIRESAPHLGRLSAERVKQEIEKTLDQVRCPSHAFTMWRSTGAFRTLIPSLAEVSDRDVAVLDFLPSPGPIGRPQRRLNRIAGLFASIPSGTVARVLGDLRFSRHDAQWISTIIARWRELGQEMSSRLAAGNPDDATIRKWVARMGRLEAGAIMRLALASWESQMSAGQKAPSRTDTTRLYRRMLRAAFHDPIDLRDLAVDGDNLKRAGISGGPRLGRILQALLSEVLEDPTRNRTDWLLQEAIRLDRSAGQGMTHESGKAQS
jgi:tRNA nucleotidyltransferase (CCA-adding enzyme)